MWVGVGVVLSVVAAVGSIATSRVDRLRERYHPDAGGLAGLRPCELRSRPDRLSRPGQCLRAIDDKLRSASVHGKAVRDSRQSHRRYGPLETTVRRLRPTRRWRSTEARTCPPRRPTNCRFLQNPSLPTVDVYAQAPTTAQGHRTGQRSRHWIRDLRQPAGWKQRPARQARRGRQLGARLGVTVDSGASKKMAVLALLWRTWNVVWLRPIR